MEFSNAVQDAEDRGLDKAVLLGNGFSVDYDPAIFRYDSLAEEADLPDLSVAKSELFERLNSTNFEAIVDSLNAAALLAELHGNPGGLAEILRADALIVKNGLADAIAKRHPEHSYELSTSEVRHARAFLSNFKQIYTLNYDLLLYWATIRSVSGCPTSPKSDGFEWPSPADQGRLIWKRDPVTPQDVFYLHGAVHLFVEDHKVRKLSYDRDGRLVDGLRDRLEAGTYPLIVTEGRREEKVARIEHSAYLRSAHQSFANINGALFVHGASLAANDDHVWDSIASEWSDVSALYVGVFGSLTSGAGRLLKERAEGIRSQREEAGGSELELAFYDSSSASVWR